MALDRQSIARRDFPARAYGDDPAAVDARVAAIADEVQELRGRSGADAAVAAAASEPPRTVLEAVERSAEAIRATARAEAREHVDRVAAGAAGLLRRIEGLQAELAATFDGLWTDAEGLRAELEAVVAAAASRRGDVVGARLVALEMAMGGRPREVTDRFLAERYDLADRAAVLDDVYAHAQG